MATTLPSQRQSSRAASFGAQVAAQTRVELLLTLRRGESVLITLIVPVVLLIFFASLNIIPTSTGKAVDFLLPGMLALAVMATGMVSLGSSPLPRSGLIGAKLISVLALEVIQIILLVGVAVLLYGWRPAGSPALALLVMAIGTVTFAGLGLAMAGALRAEVTLAGANALYLLFLLLGGGILPLSHLPAGLAALAQILPAAALTQALQAALSNNAPFPGGALLTLGIWAIIILLVAVRTFHWE